MEKEEVINLYNFLNDNNIKVVIDGGWGIDALLGKQTRPHDDLDIAVQHKDVPKLRKLLGAKGYKEIPQPDTRDYNFVLADDKGHKVDVHSYAFNSEGENIYGIKYPEASLAGTGTVYSHTVRCITPQFVIKFHENFEPQEKNLKDIKALCDKFNLEPPKNYKTQEN